MPRTIGVLALQGSFAEHITVLEGLGHNARSVRLPQELEGLDGLIIPGGESTTIGKLAVAYGLMQPLQDFGRSGKSIWGTCAGAIFLSNDIGRDQPLLGLMDIRVERNAFGRQVDSFTTPLVIPALVGMNGHTSLDGDVPPFEAVFIRAPIIESVGAGVEVLARLEDGRIVAARQGNLLATSFHPELTEDTRVHAYFVGMGDK